jgi:tetratricopeptide (TPR) repeat protein
VAASSSLGNTSCVPRKPDDVPAEVKEVAEALLTLSHKEGLTRAKLTKLPALLALTVKTLPEGSLAERARVAEDMIRTQVNSIRNLRDRVLLAAALNLDQVPDRAVQARLNKSIEERMFEACDSTISSRSPYYLEPISAEGYFRYVLTVDLALRLLGGAPTYAMPRPPSDDLDLAIRLQRSHDQISATEVLTRIANSSNNQRERREAWRLIATTAYESGNYDDAESAFEMALRNVDNMHRGGQLAMAIDRYAKRLTEEEDYSRALAIVSKGLAVFLEGRWLWRRYGCVKWYAGELFDAYAALTVALDLGYPASRVFHARGQVLAELGQYDDAIEELTEALRIPRSSQSAALARSARAFAMGMSGDLGPALEEFRDAEQIIPFSSWLHYWRGLCYLEHGQPDEASKSLVLALGRNMTTLNRLKRENAQRLLDDLPK